MSTARSDWVPEPVYELQGQAEKKGPHRALPQIRVGGRELRDVSAETLDALKRANDPPKLLSRGGIVVRVDRLEDGRPIITGITDAHLRGEMTRAADFFRLSKQHGDLRSAVSPPLDVARDLLSRPTEELGFPVLDSVAEAPFIRSDGVVICKSGYDAVARTFYSPTGDFGDFSVLEKPTTADVQKSIRLIEEAFLDFPFLDQASRANAIGLFLTPEVRPAIHGNVPAALIDAPQAGSGKSLLAEVLAIKSTGSNAVMKPAPVRADEEWRKNLTATIQSGQALAVFDNIDHQVESSHLALALTAGIWNDRILGKTALVTLPQRTIFILTGNNLMLGGDLPRRCFWIRLDAQTSEPWRNRHYRHPDLKLWVHENRSALLNAVLTLARAWCVAGCPKASTPTIGSFEEWCSVIGGILAFAGVDGFLGNLDDLYRQSDPTVAAWEAFLNHVMSRMAASGFRVADLSALLREDPSFRALLPEDLGDFEPPSGFQRRLGKAFLKRTNRRYGQEGLHLVKLDTRQGAVIWAVRKTAGTNGAGS